MCDYCDCRSHPQISTLSDEHEEILGILQRLADAVDDAGAERPSELLGELHELLHGHTIREELGVFTELRNAGVDNRLRFQADHDAVHLLLSAGGGDWRPTVATLVHLLSEHIEREETDLFPAAHQLLTPAQWADVSNATALQTS